MALQKFLVQRAENFPLNFRKKFTLSILLTKQSKLEMFPWTIRIQFWENRQKLFFKGPNIFCSKYGNKDFPWEKMFSSDWSFGHVKYSFENLVHENWTKSPNFFRTDWKSKYEVIFFQKTIFVRNDLPGTVNRVVTTLLKKFVRTTETNSNYFSKKQ